MADIRVRGAKAGQKEPRKPNISKDTVASISTAKLLYGLCEGEVYGLADGAKSIRLDGTPLVDDAGNPNFEGVTWDFRNGSNDQEYIKGFPDVSNETPINVELRSSQPWIKAFNDTQLSAVRVRFKWNRLSQTNSENGDVTGYKIDYAIDLQTDGGAYQTVLTTKIQDKTSAGYERTHRIDLPKAKTGWQLRVRRITPNSTSDLIQDTMMIDAVAEVIDVKLSYPNTALLGIQYNAELFSNIAKMSVRVKGKIIRVPDNYDPVARTYTGIWTGNFKDAYSNNPAWIFYDLCTQWRGGLGERLDATMIDRWSLYALGQYCDQPVSDGQGGLEPRFTCNVYLQKQEEAYTVLQNIAGIFRAMSFWTGEKIMLDADVPQDSIYTYSAANIVGGVAGIQYSGTRNRDRHTLAKVAWDNPNNDYQTEYEYIRDEKSMSKFGVKVLDLSAFGCTSQAQAQRAGLWALKTEQLETRQVTFSVGLDGAIPTVGNIISLSDEAFAGRANGGRVSAVSDAQYVITVDRDVTVNVGDTLIVNGGSGKSERRNIKSVAGRKITVTAPFTSAEAEHVWAVEAPDLKLMRFRVMSITENDDATYAITGIQHEPQKYDAIDFGTDVKPTEITIVNPETVDAPAAVSITSRHREVQGQMITTLVIGWSQVKGAVAYDAEWRKDDGTWVKVPRTGNVSVEIDGVYSGNYMARVRAISAFDVQSNPTSSILTEVKGKAGKPPKLLSLRATGLLFGMRLDWAFSPGSGDTAYTEIQVASAPDVNVAALGQFAYSTDTHTINGLQGGLTQHYRGRIVDKLGNTSDWTAWISGTTDNSVDKILDIISGEIDDSALSDALKQKIERIDDLDDALTLETQARIDEILAANNAIQKENIDRIAAVKAATDAITAEQGARVQAITQMGAGLTTKIDKNKTDLVDVNARTDTLVTKTGQNLAAIQEETRLRTAEDSALAGRITTLVAQTGDNTTAITQEAEARSTADEAQGKLITALTTRTKNAETAITTETTARTTADTAIGERVDAIKVTADGNSGLISTETSARVAADGVLTRRIGLAEAETTKAVGRIATVEQTSSDNKAAVAKVRTDLVAEYKAADKVVNDKVVLNTAAISSESETRATQDEALSKRINTVTATAGANSGKIVAEEKARADADSALTQRISNAESVTSGALGRITTVEKTASDNTKAVAKVRTDVTAEFDNMEIGGRNILANSDMRNGFVPWNSDSLVTQQETIGVGYYTMVRNMTTDGTFGVIQPSKYRTGKIYEGVTYTLSWLGQGTFSGLGYLHLISTKKGNYRLPFVPLKNGRTNKYEIVFTAPYTTDDLHVLMGAVSQPKDAWFSFANIMLQKGNKATEWTPSPEDSGELIEANKAAVQSEAEARADADTAIGKLVTAVTARTAAAEGKITTLTQATADNNTAIAQSKQVLEARFDKLLVGGENLIVNSMEEGFFSTFGSSAHNLTSKNSGYETRILRSDCLIANGIFGFTTQDRNIGIIEGQEYTLSFHGQATFQNLNYVYLMREDGDNFLLPSIIMGSGMRNRKTLTFTAPWSTSKGYLLLAAKSETEGSWFAIGGLMLQKGNSATEFVPNVSGTRALLAQESKATADKFGKMELEWTVKTDIGGRIAGFGLLSKNDRTDFAVNADYFWIAPPTGTAKGTKPFMVLTSPKTINGVTVPAGTYMDAAYIHDGSIDLAKINTAKIINLSALSSDLGKVTAGSININNKFTVDKLGNMTAVGGYFSGEIAANTIDVSTLKRSAWLPKWQTYRSSSQRVAPTDFLAYELEFSGSLPSMGAFDLYYRGEHAPVGAMMLEMTVLTSKATQLTQKIAGISDEARLYVNGALAVLVDSRSHIVYLPKRPLANHFTPIVVDIPKGVVKLQWVIKNTQLGDIEFSVLGDFIDNDIIKNY